MKKTALALLVLTTLSFSSVQADMVKLMKQGDTASMSPSIERPEAMVALKSDQSPIATDFSKPQVEALMKSQSRWNQVR